VATILMRNSDEVLITRAGRKGCGDSFPKAQRFFHNKVTHDAHRPHSVYHGDAVLTLSCTTRRTARSTRPPATTREKSSPSTAKTMPRRAERGLTLSRSPSGRQGARDRRFGGFTCTPWLSSHPILSGFS
jgi:hypothetical protein